MAKRYRYAFARQKESEGGILSTALAAASLLMFLVDLILSCMFMGEGIAGPIMGGVSVCGMLLSVYGFIQGLRSLARKNRRHTYSTAGAIANGVIMVGWLCLFLLGL